MMVNIAVRVNKLVLFLWGEELLGNKPTARAVGMHVPIDVAIEGLSSRHWVHCPKELFKKTVCDESETHVTSPFWVDEAANKNHDRSGAGS